MPDEYDPLPAIIAGIDQAIEVVPQYARYARALFDAFKDAGFDDEQALLLTIDKLNG